MALESKKISIFENFEFWDPVYLTENYEVARILICCWRHSNCPRVSYRYHLDQMSPSKQNRCPPAFKNGLQKLLQLSYLKGCQYWRMAIVLSIRNWCEFTAAINLLIQVPFKNKFHYSFVNDTIFIPYWRGFYSKSYKNSSWNWGYGLS